MNPHPAIRFLAAAAISLASIGVAHAQQTYFDMAAGNYSQDFTSISSWSNNYSAGTGAENWRVATSVASSLVTNVAVFVSGSAGGVQKGTNSMVLLSTGTNTGGTDLLLNFSGRIAGNMSFDWAKIANTATNTPRTSDLKVQFSTNNGANFADVTGYAIPRIANSSTPESGSLSITLPTNVSGQSQTVLRIFMWNNGETGGSGNRPKWNIDNLLVTSTPSSSNAPIVTDFTPTSGPAGTAVTIGGSNFTGATNVAFNGIAATFSNVTATNLNATVPVGATTGPISVWTTNGTGLSSSNFIVPTVTVILPASINEGVTTTAEVAISETNASDVNVTLTSSSTNDLTIDPAPIIIFAGLTNAFYNITAPADNTVDGNTNVTVTPAATGYVPVADTITVFNVDASKIPLTNFTTNSYTQNFDSLGTATISNVISLTTGTQTGLGAAVSTNLNGWYAAKIAGSAGISNIVADNGSGFSGAVYNYGTTSNANRSLGALASGSLTAGFGALVYNDTGTTINSIIINLTGKFWRPSAANTNTLNFAYGVVDGTTVNNNNFLTTSAATNLPPANIVGPVVATTNDQTPLDGNNPINQVLISNVTIPVQILPGETMFFRWQDFDNTSSDAGLAIDDLNLTASTNLPTPTVASVTVNPFSLTESQVDVASSVISDNGSALTDRGFVYSQTSLNTNPVIGGPNVTAITNSPAVVGSYTNNLSTLLASTAYSVRSFAVNGNGTNYSAPLVFNTLAPNPAFTGVYTQSFNGLTNTVFPAGWRCLSTSNINNYAGDWNATNSTSVGFYGRTNIPGILGYLHGAATGILSNKLTLVNNTGGTLTNLWVSYQGEVNVLNPTSNLRFPEWAVVVDGQPTASLNYSTAGGVSSNLLAEINGLSITNGGNIVISWSSDRGAGSGSSRLIGMTSVRVATNAPVVTPTISVTGSFTNFLTTVGTNSPSQTLTVSGSNLTNNITVSMPFNYQVSTNNTNFSYASVDLVPSGGTVTNTTLYFRLFATNYVGLANGNLLFDSPTAFEVFPVNGFVNSSFTYWLNGAPSNSANQLNYAIGGATGPTATNGIASQTAVTSSNLSITAIVRTNDPSLSVFGEGTTNLITGSWSTNGVSQMASTNQSGVPTGNQRQIFSIPRSTNTQMFLRLDAILQP